jgi:hypothetical protein
MAYAVKNFPSKKSLKEAVAAGEKVTIFNPGLGVAPLNGQASLEGPHYPKPHSWYASVTMKDGYVVKVK